MVTAVSASSGAETAGLGSGDVITGLQTIAPSATDPFDTAFADYGAMSRRYMLALVGTKGGDRWVTLPVDPRSTPTR